MKRLTGIFVLFLILSSCSAKKLEAYFSYSTFYSPESGPYIETYLSIIGNSLQHIENKNTQYQGIVEVLYIFYQYDKISNFKKFKLLSPALTDTTGSFPNFLDQQRILLPNGNYKLEIQLTDINNPEKPVTSIQELTIEYSNNKVDISQVEFVESYQKSEKQGILSKSGFDVIPYVSNYFPNNLDRLKFYCEIYNSKKLFGDNSMYLIKYYIEKYESARALSNYLGFVRQNSDQVNVVLREINIEKLPTGNYNLVVEVRNRENELLNTKKTFFQRLNPDIQINPNDFNTLNIYSTFAENIKSKDTLIEYINTLRPIADRMENNFASKDLAIYELELLQKYFYSFWLSRNESTPEKEWIEYNNKVAEVDEVYGFINIKGYDTDRGQIQLKYGKPNQIAKSYNEPSSYPYEIWHYYKTPNKSDAKFVFYNPSLVGENFELLHSNVYGELNDYRWKVRLQKRNDQNPNLDDTEGSEHFGGRLDNLFESPR